MGDLERQEDELMVLSSIYGDDCFSTSESTKAEDHLYSGHFLAELTIKSPLFVLSSSSDVLKEIQYFPSISFEFTLPPDYPSCSAPQFMIEGFWLTESQISRLSEKLLDLWNETKGEEVLFRWTNFLRLESFDYLDIHSPLVLSDTCFQAIVDYDRYKRQEAFNQSQFPCDVCLAELVPGKDCTRFDPCGHVFCNVCVSSHFELNIKSGSVEKLSCPSNKCESVAELSQIKRLVSPELFERYDQLLLQMTLESMKDIRYCPNPRCTYPVTVDQDGGIGMCPTCKFVFCVQCRKASHGIEPCKSQSDNIKQLYAEYVKASHKEKEYLRKKYGNAYIQKMLDDASTEDWLKDNSKPCPRCRTNIEKIDGCNKMVCRKCRTYFCWLCLTVISRNNPYAHYKNEDLPCYNKLFLGTDGGGWDEEGEEWIRDEQWAEAEEWAVGNENLADNGVVNVAVEAEVYQGEWIVDPDVGGEEWAVDPVQLVKEDVGKVQEIVPKYAPLIDPYWEDIPDQLLT